MSSPVREPKPNWPVIVPPAVGTNPVIGKATASVSYHSSAVG
jgi:hypothetical protein